MNPTSLIANTTALLVSSGVGTIVGNAIKATTPTEISTFNKVTITVGSLALSGLAGGAAARHINDQVAGVRKQVQELKNLRTK